MRRSINRDRVRELRDSGASVTEIAAQLGCGKSGVSKVLKSMRGAPVNATPVVITDGKLLQLLQALYDRIWALKAEGFPGVPRRLLLDRLRMLVAVVKE